METNTAETHETASDTQTQPHTLMRFFAYDHLPEHLQNTSRQFATLAQWIDTTLPTGAEKTVTLRKLLESKDCAVRANL